MLVLRTTWTWDLQPVPPDEEVELSIGRLSSELVQLRVDAPFWGDPAPNGPPGPTDRLWEHEVAEIFVVGPHGAYTEIELGCWGHHLVLRLAGRRQVVESALPLVWTSRIGGGRWTGHGVLPRALLPPAPHRANLAAIHGVGSARRYLSSSRLGGAQPDFHQPDRFTEVEIP